MTLSIRGASYRYPGGGDAALRGVDLQLKRGEFALLTGPTGCGKSTLLRLAGGITQRHGGGEWSGSVTVEGENPGELPPSRRVRLVGFVSQNPGDQLVAGRIGEEVAFALESAGLERDEIERRVLEALEAVDLSLPLDHPTTALSGGQTQRLVVAAAIAAAPPLLLLDEPLSQLDPAASELLLQTLQGIASRGTTVLMVEHRLEACLPQVDRVISMRDGELLGEGAELARRLYAEAPTAALDRKRWSGTVGGPLLSIKGARFRWPGASEETINGIDLSIGEGELVALIGENGAGKSTLLQGLAGHLDIGRVERPGSLVDVPQDPDLALFCESVRSELAYGPVEMRLPQGEVEELTATAAERLNLTELLERPPQALSRGQRLRAAVAAALPCRRELLLLDEPTSGQDSHNVRVMMAALSSSSLMRGLLFATHDLSLAREFSTRVIRLESGRIVADGPPEEVLG